VSPLELLSTGLVGIGVFFVAISAIGFVRLPDVFCRLHVTGVIDTLGAPMIMLGVAVHLGAQLVSLKLLMAIGLLVITSPMLGHLLARAALEAGHRPARLDEDTTAGTPTNTGTGGAS